MAVIEAIALLTELRLYLPFFSGHIGKTDRVITAKLWVTQC
ncbi:hypothetical protein [Leptolyngbya sp. FACHB-16]|nr:hypothetical protein [Leptolyngbya sp. FACHB-16]